MTTGSGGFGSLQVTANPVFERALHGPGIRESWGFSPAGRIGYQRFPRFAPSVEYYSAWGPVPRFRRVTEQVHQLYFGGDWKIRENLPWNAGAEMGLTGGGERLVFKSRLEFEFGRKD